MMSPVPAMDSSETSEALYYVEQKAKIGSIELSLKPNTEALFAVSVSSKSLNVCFHDTVYTMIVIL